MVSGKREAIHSSEANRFLVLSYKLPRSPFALATTKLYERRLQSVLFGQEKRNSVALGQREHFAHVFRTTRSISNCYRLLNAKRNNFCAGSSRASILGPGYSQALQRFHFLFSFFIFYFLRYRILTMATRVKPAHFSETGMATIGIVGAGLGILFGFGLGLGLMSENYYDIGLYFFLFAIFHFWEFLYVALFHPEDLSVNCTFLALAMTFVAIDVGERSFGIVLVMKAQSCHRTATRQRSFNASKR